MTVRPRSVESVLLRIDDACERPLVLLVLVLVVLIGVPILLALMEAPVTH